MFDFGWPELLLVAAVVILVTGPDDIPKILHGAGRMMRRFQYLRFSMSRHLDAFMRENDLQDIRNMNVEPAITTDAQDSEEQTEELAEEEEELERSE
jgi:sec-independent protein translocase protein TatB